MRPSARLGAWTATLLLIGALLWWLGRGSLSPSAPLDASSWASWVATRDAPTMAMAVLRAAALAATAYLLAVTLLAWVADTTRSGGLGRILHATTSPAIRGLLRSAAGLGVSATLVLGALPASAAGPHRSTGPSEHRPHGVATMHLVAPSAPGTASVRRVTAEPPPDRGGASSGTASERFVPPRMPSASTTTTEAAPTPTTSTTADAPTTAGATTTAGAAPSAPAPSTPAPPAPAAVATTPQAAGTVWLVAPGDSFWSQAAHVLETTWGRPPTDAEIVPYWRRLIEANRARLADPANPDLIFPGQRFTVPAPSAP